jgi:hypothetical protein
MQFISKNNDKVFIRRWIIFWINIITNEAAYLVDLYNKNNNSNLNSSTYYRYTNGIYIIKKFP